MPWNAKARFLPIAAALAIGVITPAGAANVRGGTAMTHVATAANAFGIDLLGKLVQAKPDGNCFLSPYSIQQALLLADNGAGGATKAQIEAVLHLQATPLATINAQSKALRESLTVADPKVRISVANALWADRSFKFNASYQETCRAFYDAQTRTIALRAPSGAAAINAWVAQKTKGKIDGIVSQADLADAVAVLTNAVYFHGAWTTPFEAHDTRPQPFHLTGSTTKQVPMMSRLTMFDYAKGADWEAAALPYGGGRLRMVVVLPSENSSVNKFLHTLTSAQWANMTRRLKTTRLQLFLPKVHTEYRTSLKPVLDSLRMRAPFHPGADFTNMNPDHGLMISDVIHKTTLDIDEQGTTAAAASAVVMSLSIALPTPAVTMRVDRPFCCAIQDTKTGLMLFAGAIRNPQ